MKTLAFSPEEIVLFPKATPVEKNAAFELQNYIRQITGKKLQIVSTVSSRPAILIGHSKKISKLMPDINFEKLGDDEVIIRSIGKSLIVSGGLPRGTIYAVYILLEKYCGVDFLTPKVTIIRKRKKLNLPIIKYRYSPPVKIREVNFLSTSPQNPYFALRMKLNGHYVNIPQKLGGHQRTIGFVHTFNKILPSNIYFKTNPDFYSVFSGKRSKNRQLCLTNKYMRKEFVKNTLVWIRRENQGVISDHGPFDKKAMHLKKYNKAKMISISQNDDSFPCSCLNCKKIDDFEESSSGSLLKFVNYVAEEIEKIYPEMYIVTLAYTYSKNPPKNIRPRHNVIIQLCSIECDFNHPLKEDHEFVERLKKWHKIAPKLFIWNYAINFQNPLIPHPNIRNYGEDIRLFVKNGAISIYEEGDFRTPFCDFSELRVYLLSKLLWNPQADQNKLEDHFLKAYYGGAATSLKKYLDMIHSIPKPNLGCLSAPSTLTWFKIDHLKSAYRFYKKAQEKVKNSPVYLKRLRRTRLSLDFAYLDLVQHMSKKQLERYRNELPNPIALLNDIEQVVKKNNEFNRLPKNYFAKLLAKYRKKLRKCQRRIQLPLQFKDRKCHDFQEFDSYNNIEKLWKPVKDPSASDGNAACFNGASPMWAFPVYIPTIVINSIYCKLYVAIRCEESVQKGQGVKIGIYDRGGEKYLLEKIIPATNIRGDKYKIIDLGTVKIQGRPEIYAAGIKGKGKDYNVYIDRFILEEK